MNKEVKYFKSVFCILMLNKNIINFFIKPKMSSRIVTLSLICIEKRIIMLAGLELTSLIDISSCIYTHSNLYIKQTR